MLDVTIVLVEGRGLIGYEGRDGIRIGVLIGRVYRTYCKGLLIGCVDGVR